MTIKFNISSTIRTTLSAGTAICWVSGAAMADDSPDIKGIGATQCPEVMQSLKAHANAASYVYGEWVNGMMSGANMVAAATGRPARDLHGSTQELVIKAVTEWCLAHTDDTLSDAAARYWLSQPKTGGS